MAGANHSFNSGQFDRLKLSVYFDSVDQNSGETVRCTRATRRLYSCDHRLGSPQTASNPPVLVRRSLRCCAPSLTAHATSATVPDRQRNLAGAASVLGHTERRGRRPIEQADVGRLRTPRRLPSRTHDVCLKPTAALFCGARPRVI